MNDATEAERSATLTAVGKLIPEIEARADEIEQQRRVPADLNEQLMKAGAYRMALPRKYGGVELEPLQSMRVIEELAHADGSRRLDRDGGVRIQRPVRTLLARGGRQAARVRTRARARRAGAAGNRRPTNDGYIISGRWPLASGTYDHHWVAAGCLVTENGKPKMAPEGRPAYRMAMLPKEQAEFLDTWYSVGLCGSDSTDFVITDRFVPEAFTTDIFVAPSAYDSILHRLPFMMVTGPTHCAVCLGLTQGAIDDLSELARHKRPAFVPRPPGEDPIFQYRFGELAVRSGGGARICTKRRELDLGKGKLQRAMCPARRTQAANDGRLRPSRVRRYHRQGVHARGFDARLPQPHPATALARHQMCRIAFRG